MENNRLPSLFAYLPLALLLALSGWGGLFYVVMFTLPTVGPRWLFFFFLFLALVGTSLPIMAMLNWRFPGKAPAGPVVVSRQAVWVGFFGCVLAWLQLGQILTTALGLLVAVGFVMIEWMLRLAETSTWNKTP